jgi:hypothetical protein
MSTILINPFILFPAAAGGATDPDAAAYIAAVEAEDGDVLEAGVVTAIDNFVIGCKADGIWAAIKACCILAGARTLDGALVPLVGPAPTNFNFLAGDYNRAAGLKGDGSTKYLRAGIDGSDVAAENFSLSANLTDPGGVVTNGWVSRANDADTLLFLGRYDIGTRDGVQAGGADTRASVPRATTSLGFHGAQGSSATQRTYRSNNGQVVSSSGAGGVPGNTSFCLFRAGENVTGQHSSARFSFFHIGLNLGLEMLNYRVDLLMDQITFAVNTGLDPSNYQPETVAYVAAGYRNGGTLA